MRRFLPLAIRDSSLVLVASLLWLTDAWFRRHGGSGWPATIIGLVTGGMTVVCAFLMHEWGHLAGASSTGAVVQPARRLWTIFLFSFDTARSSRAQFLAMSVGGYVASVLSLVLIVVFVPWDALSGQVALGLSALGIAATFAMEVPVTFGVWRGAPLPRGGVYTGLGT